MFNCLRRHVKFPHGCKKLKIGDNLFPSNITCLQQKKSLEVDILHTTLLLGSQPLIVSRELAMELGVDLSLVLQQFQYWIRINEESGKNYFENRYWTSSTIEELQERDFPFWGKTKIKTLINELIKYGYLEKKQFHNNILNHTNYYTINYDKILELEKISKNRHELKKSEALIQSKKAEQNTELVCDQSISRISDQSISRISDQSNYKENKIKENKYNNKSSSIYFNNIKLEHRNNEDDDDLKKEKINNPSYSEIKEFIDKLQQENPEGIYIPAKEFWSKMFFTNWTFNGKQIKNWKNYYLRCCDNKQFKSNIEPQTIKKGKSYDFTTSGNKAAYDRLLKNAS